MSEHGSKIRQGGDPPRRRSAERQAQTLSRALRTALLAAALLTIGSLFSGCTEEPGSQASSLTPEQRREYDRQFFNELETWNANSAEYSFDTREALFRKMARDGYQVAEIALEIFQPSRGRIVTSRSALDKLQRLADSGDASAMCFLSIAWTKMDQKKVPYQPEVGRKYIERGAALGQPYCKFVLATLYGSGEPGYPKDLGKARRMIREVALEGYYIAHLTLFNHYSMGEQPYADLGRVRKALCWGRLAQQHSAWAFFDHYVDRMNQVASREKRPELRALGDQWDTRDVPVEAWRVTPEECLKIEQEG